MWAAGAWPALLIAVVGAGVAQALRIWAGVYLRVPPLFPTATTCDGAFHFCRVMFTSDRREKQGWSTDIQAPLSTPACVLRN
jgi:hypothetical protein